MDFFDNCYYNINKILLSLVGIWPYQNSKERILRMIPAYAVLNITIIFLVGKFFTTEYNMDLLVDVFSILLPNLCYYCSYCTYHLKLKKIKKLFDMIKFDWEELKNPEELAIIKKYAIKSKNYTIVLAAIFISFFFMIILSYCLPHLLDIIVPLNETRKTKMILPIETFFKIEETIYGIISIIFGTACFGVIAVAVYGSFLLFIQHTCGMLSLTGFILEHVFIKSEQYVYTSNENKIIYKNIIRSIRFHIRTLKFFDYLKDISKECYSIQISLALILVASDYIKLMQIKEDILEKDIGNVTICIIHVIGIMFSLFINCHAGQQIIDHSNNVFQKAKIAPWYLVSTKIQKSAIMILMRSQKTCYFYVSGTFVSSYEFFLSLLKVSISYATVYYSMQ